MAREMINLAMLIEVVLVIHFCISFHKNKKAFPIARQKFEVRGTGAMQPYTLVQNGLPCPLIFFSLVRLCVKCWLKGLLVLVKNPPVFLVAILLILSTSATHTAWQNG